MYMMRSVYIALCLLLCLLNLQAAVVTYTITSRTAVRADGIEPTGGYAQYEQSATGGRMGQMTAGNSTALTLYGYGGKRIRSITLSMRSNASAGAGSLEMMQGDVCVWGIETAHFSSDVWNGAYSTSYVPVTHLFAPCLSVGKGDVLSVYIDAQVSSLYIQSYTIEYFDEWDMPFTVEFHTGTHEEVASQTESVVGDGICLPACVFTDALWHFAGWTETAVEQTGCRPSYLRAGEMYYPHADTRLYALYTDGEQRAEGLLQDTLFATGTYLIADAVWHCLAVGGLNKDKVVPTLPLAPLSETEDALYLLPAMEIPVACLYAISFQSDSMALIRHVETGNYIAPPAADTKALQNTERAWRWHRQEDNSVKFQSPYAAQAREFRAACGTTLATVDSIWFANNTLSSSAKGNLLFRVDTETERPIVSYTSFPLGRSAVQDMMLPVWRQEGNRIINPMQTLLRLYSVNGVLLRLTRGDMDLSVLPAGVYLLAADGRCSKIVVR